MTDGGADITTAEEKALDNVRRALPDGGAVETVGVGGVGGERREEKVQIGLECTVRLVEACVRTVMGYVRWNCFTYRAK